MKLSSRQHALQSKSLEVSMTSMIDVVFLLLIFFLVTTSFFSPESQLASNINVQRQASGLSAQDIEPAIMTIYKNGNQVIFQMGAVRSTNLKDFDSLLDEYVAKQNGGFVQVADEVSFDNVAQAIGRFRSNGFGSVSYLTAE